MFANLAKQTLKLGPLALSLSRLATAQSSWSQLLTFAISVLSLIREQMLVKAVLSVLVVIPGLVAQTGTSILTGSTAHDDYLFNSSWSYYERDYLSLPHFFYYVNAYDPPSSGTLRAGTACSSVSPYNCVVSSNSDYSLGTFDWYNFWSNVSTTGIYPLPSPAVTLTSVNGGTIPAVTGEYWASSGSTAQTSVVGFEFLGEFIGQPSSASTSPGTYLEAAYFSSREFFDGGTEYGFYHAPAWAYYGCNSGTSCGGAGLTVADQYPNVINFYYSIYTNCNTYYLCATGASSDDTVFQKTNTYTITFNAANSSGNFQWDYKVINAGTYFAISITDPNNGNAAASCTITQVTALSNTSPSGLVSSCSSGEIPIDSTWFPSGSSTSSGWIAFADQSSTEYPYPFEGLSPNYNYFPINTNNNVGPPSNVSPSSYSSYTNGSGTPAAYAGFDVQWAKYWHN